MSRALHLLVAALALLACGRAQEVRRSAYETDLAELENAIREMYTAADPGADPGVSRRPLDQPVRARHALLLLDRWMLTSRPAHLEEARAALARETPFPGPLQARLREMELRLALSLHRVERARELLGDSDAHSADRRRRVGDPAVAAEIALSDGRYRDARTGFEAAVRARESWEGLAQLANVEAILGRWSDARLLYRQAQDRLTARQMRQYAWLEVQLGALEFRLGRFQAARDHYTRADRAYSGYWLVREHLAELDAAEGNLLASIERYLRVSVATGRPEIEQVLGELYALAGDPAQARLRQARALAGYGASVARGDVHYFHHLAGFHSDVSGNSREALKWARADLLVRQRHEAHDALAWALYRSGHIGEAEKHVALALASGARDAHVYEHAAAISFAAKRAVQGRRYLLLADGLNPRRADFHAHR